MKLAVCVLALLSVGVLASSVLAGGYTTGPVRWGDSDCNNDVTAGDVGYVLQYLAGTPKAPPPSARCPTVGDTTPVMIWPRVWGDIDCSGTVTPIDALAVLRYLSGLPFTPSPTPPPTPTDTPPYGGPSCPTVGDGVSLNDKTPTPTPRSPTPT